MKKEERKTPSYPQPYKVIDGCLYREVRTKNGSYDQKLCNFLPYIVSEITLDDGAEESKRLRLGGVRQDGGQLPEIEILGSDLSNFNWLIDQWGADCILEVGTAIKDSVRYAIQQTACEADRQTVYAVTGWKKINHVWRFLMPGDASLSVQLPDKLSRYEGVSEAQPEALLVLTNLLENPPAPKKVIWPLLAYCFLSPLNSFLHQADCEPKFVFLLLGRTGTCKSSLAALFLSFFGRFTASDLPMSFRDTANSITYNAFALKDVLTCIDDFHPCGKQEEQKLTATAQAVVRAYGDRTGRGRLRSDASPMAARPPQGNAIITAEFPPDIGESGTARSLAVELKPGDVDLAALSVFQAEAAKGSLQSCMAEYIRWLWGKFLHDEETVEQFLSVLRKEFEFHREAFRRSGVQCHGRLPEIVAWLQIGMTMLLLLLMERGFLREEQVEAYRKEFSGLLYELARKQAGSIEQDKPAYIFVRKLIGLIESGQVSVLRRNETVAFAPKDLVGYEDETFYYLLNDAAHRAVRKLCEEQGELFSIGSRSLPRALAEEALIDASNGENTKAIRFGDSTKRVVCLYKDRAKRIADEWRG